ncbi:hypothetical protein TWF694_003912 [Orbilia ellipsospora]|uniref:Orc1-like AAA ATPase domain-containing protein n=1 Tax=Orbilia ellipsospora TaxID=2528407 RepID=A0AAV9WWF7_9PEZI
MSQMNSLYKRYPCRDQQINSLTAILTRDTSKPPALILYGTEATGKTVVAKAVLDEIGIAYAYVSCKECITVRHIFEKAYTSCVALVGAPNGTQGSEQKSPRPDSVNNLAVMLQKLLLHSRPIILVLDGVDKQREITSTILSGVARMGDMIENLTVVLVVTAYGPRLLNSSEPPSIHFPAYSKEECVKILSLSPKSIFEIDNETEYSSEMENEDRWLWTQCCSAIWDIMGKYAARNVNALKDVVDELWPSLVRPIVENEYGIRDFPKLFNRLKNEELRHSEEIYLASRIVTSSKIPSDGDLEASNS